MAKSNQKSLEENNFWDLRWVHGRLAGKPKVNADDIKRLHKAKKDRLRLERKRSNYFKHHDLCGVRTQCRDKQQKKHDQIQYGIDLCNWLNELHA